MGGVPGACRVRCRSRCLLRPLLVAGFSVLAIPPRRIPLFRVSPHAIPAPPRPVCLALAALPLAGATLAGEGPAALGLGIMCLTAGLLIGARWCQGAALLAAAERAPLPLVVFDAAGRPSASNAAYRRLPDPVAAAMRDTALGATTALSAPNGRWWAVQRLPLPGGQVLALAADITPLHAAEAAQAAMHRQALDLAPVPLWLLDRAGATVFANRALAALFGGRTPASLAASALVLPPAPADGPCLGIPTDRPVEASLPGTDRRRRQVTVTAVPWPGAPGGPGLCLSLADNAPLRAAQARVEHLAEHDALTGLANRAQFRSALVALSQAPRGGVLFLIDLDRFSLVNDRHGMAVGDSALRTIARRLRGMVRPGDLVCRLGDDRFAVLAFGAPVEARDSIAARLLQAIAEPIRLDGVNLRLGASLGSASAPDDAAFPEPLLRAADLAQRAARAAGGHGHAAFEPALREGQERRDRLLEALVDALDQGGGLGGGLHLHYQPQRHWPDGRLAGVEALLRWHCPALGGPVSPGELLPVAAEAGLLPRIDTWVLETAMRRIAAWRGVPGAPSLVSVNISVTGLRDPGFPDQVARALVRHTVPASGLEIEIPEEIAVCDLPAIEATLAALAALGVRLALDDFGSGHSSLPHMVRLPVHRLKLDRSIVSGLPGDAKAHAVLQATMAMARDLGIEVIGEGVETGEQAAALAEAGCTLLQGWLVGRPAPAEVLCPEAVPALAAE